MSAFPKASRAAALAMIASLTIASASAGVAHAASGTVATNGATLIVRSTASTSGAVLTQVPNGTSLNLICKTTGTTVSGTQGQTSVWDKVTYAGKTGFVSAAYVRGGASGAVPSCSTNTQIRGTVRTSGATLTIRSSASTSGAVVGSLPNGTTVALACRTTGTTVSGSQGTTSIWVRVSYGGATGYASGAYITNASSPGVCSSTPTPPPASGYPSNPYAAAWGPNGGYTSRARWMKDTIEARYPGITCNTYASSSGEHSNGNALDCWGPLATRRAMAEWVSNGLTPLRVYYVIHEQKIKGTWTAGQWRWMEDRGSITQNHYDHVHVSVKTPNQG